MRGSGLSGWVRALARPAAAVAGGVLVVAGLLVPAQAASAGPETAPSGLTDLTTVTPIIEGSGSLSGTDGYLCSAVGASGVSTPCSSISLSSLPGLTKTELVPQAASDWSFSGWSSCPDVTASDSCVIDTSLLGDLLGTTLQPVATFLPSLDGGGGGLTPPDTKITGTPAVDASDNTTATSAAFDFVVVGNATNPSFQCQLAGPGHGEGYSACGTGSSGSKSYQDLAPGDYTFAVRSVADGLTGTLTDQTPDQFSWTITPASPSTQLRGGPRQNGWLLAGHVAFGLHSDQTGATYACTVDGTAQPCGDRLVVRHLSAGTHTVSAAATAGGQTDASPARRTFSRPVNDRALTHSRGWRLHHRRGYFLGSYSQARRHGATLRIRAGHIRRIALVAATGHRFGVVKVYLGRHLLKRVPLRARRLHKQRVIPVARFRRPRRGTVRVVVVSHGRVVRVDGLGIAGR